MAPNVNWLKQKGNALARESLDFQRPQGLLLCPPPWWLLAGAAATADLVPAWNSTRRKRTRQALPAGLFQSGEDFCQKLPANLPSSLIGWDRITGPFLKPSFCPGNAQHRAFVHEESSMDKAGMGLPLTGADPGPPLWEMDGQRDTDPTLVSALLGLTGNRLNSTMFT